MDMLRRFYEEEDGMGTVELVMIMAALMGIALLFRKQLTDFAKAAMGKLFNNSFIQDPNSVVTGT